MAQNLIRSGPVWSKNRNGWRVQQELKNCSKNENTAKSTGFWLSFWKNWCVGKEITDEIENYEPAELFFVTLCSGFSTPTTNNKKGEDYEPGSLKVIMTSFDRHLRNKGCAVSIVRDSFAWLAVVSAQTKLVKYQRRKKKLSGGAENLR